MAHTQAELREMAAQLSDQAKELRAALHRSMARDEISLAMFRDASAHVGHVVYGIDSARSALSEFMALDAIEMAEAEEASTR